ncbi:RidA family protein [Actinoplanes sp. NPDC051851]|uniref:RidA family protein n=1 Tax=Actinoplanes sp. NPDC051851 TaxID=3154753 RepID=UPI003420FFE9
MSKKIAELYSLHLFAAGALMSMGACEASPASSPGQPGPSCSGTMTGMELQAHRPVDGVYPATDDYAHAMEVRGAQRLLFVAGTMGLRQDGTPGATLAEQLDLVWSNIRAILAAAQMTVDNIVRLTSYLTDASHAGANAAARVAALGGRVVPTTAIVVQTLDSGWLIEIEVIAAA